MQEAKSSRVTFWFIAVLVGASMTVLFVGGRYTIQTPAAWEYGLHGLTVAEYTVLSLALCVVTAASMLRLQRLYAPATLGSAIRQIRWLLVVVIAGFIFGTIDSSSPPRGWQDILGRLTLVIAVLVVMCVGVYWLQTNVESRGSSGART